MEKQAEIFLRDKETYWVQRAKADWLAKGDKNTKFLHAKASFRKKNNGISGIKDEAGQWHSDSDKS